MKCNRVSLQALDDGTVRIECCCDMDGMHKDVTLSGDSVDDALAKTKKIIAGDFKGAGVKIDMKKPKNVMSAFLSAPDSDDEDDDE